jgi:hypothetical protein
MASDTCGEISAPRNSQGPRIRCRMPQEDDAVLPAPSASTLEGRARRPGTGEAGRADRPITLNLNDLCPPAPPSEP